MKALNRRYVTLRGRQMAMAVAGALAAFSAWGEPMNAIPNHRDADLSRWTDNYVEAGIAASSGERTFKFGEWTGMHRHGAFPILNFNWASRAPAARNYWNLSGFNLGLDSRQLSFGFGNQGTYDFFFDFQQVPRFQTESARFIHRGLGTNSLTLPAGYVGFAQPNAGAAVILPLLTGFDIKQNRDIYRAGLGGSFTNEWTFKTSFREDRRDGHRLIGAQIGSFRSTILPYPIDDKTQQAEAVLAYAKDALQLQFGYYYSNYTNDIQSLTWTQPYSGVANTTAGVTAGRLGLWPSNEFHQASASAGYNFSKVTRLSGTLSWGRATQNEPFLPYTSNTNPVVLAALTPQPRTSLDGKVDHTLFDLVFTTRPVEKANLKLGYQYREGDNKTPRAEYRFVRVDAVTPTLQDLRTNAPVSTEEQKAVIDADYEIARRTYVRGLYEHKQTRYTFTDRSRTRDNKLGLEVRGPLSASVSGSIGYQYNLRTGSHYNKNSFFENTYNPAYVATRGFENHPSLRQYLYADHSQNRWRASANWTLSETVTLGGSAERFDQKNRGPGCADKSDPLVAALLVASALPETCLGRRRLDGENFNIDLQWQPEPEIVTVGFYTHSRYGTDQAGRQWTQTAPVVPAAALSTAFDWSVRSRYRDDVLGAGITWKARENWEVGSQYAYSEGVGRHAFFAGSGIALQPTPVPDLTNRLHNFQAFTKWKQSRKVTWRLNYMYEDLKNSDWAYDNATPVSTTNVLLTGQQAPRYKNHVLGLSLSVQDW